MVTFSDRVETPHEGSIQSHRPLPGSGKTQTRILNAGANTVTSASMWVMVDRSDTTPWALHVFYRNKEVHGRHPPPSPAACALLLATHHQGSNDDSPPHVVLVHGFVIGRHTHFEQ